MEVPFVENDRCGATFTRVSCCFYTQDMQNERLCINSYRARDICRSFCVGLDHNHVSHTSFTQPYKQSTRMHQHKRENLPCPIRHAIEIRHIQPRRNTLDCFPFTKHMHSRVRMHVPTYLPVVKNAKLALYVTQTNALFFCWHKTCAQFYTCVGLQT